MLPLPPSGVKLPFVGGVLPPGTDVAVAVTVGVTVAADVGVAVTEPSSNVHAPTAVQAVLIPSISIARR